MIIRLNENPKLKTNSYQSHSRRLRSTADARVLVQFPAQNPRASLIEQLGTGKPAKTPISEKIVVSESRPTLRRGLRRMEAADYIGVSASKFDALVKGGRMPLPKRIDGCVVWDIRQLDSAFEKLPGGDDDDQNPWDE